jgi:HD superfamily phosphohydrolase
MIGMPHFHIPGEKTLFEDKLGHEDYSIPIIRSSRNCFNIDGYKDKTGVSSEKIISVLDNKWNISIPILLKELIAGYFDVDKMDYLLRILITVESNKGNMIYHD